MAKQPKVTVELMYEHAGWGYHPAYETQEEGRRRGARGLYAAWHLARESGCEWEWKIDSDPDVSWMEPEDLRKARRGDFWECYLYGPNGSCLDCICGVHKPSPEYRRVVEAELAAEAEEILIGRLLPI